MRCQHVPKHDAIDCSDLNSLHSTVQVQPSFFCVRPSALKDFGHVTCYIRIVAFLINTTARPVMFYSDIGLNLNCSPREKEWTDLPSVTDNNLPYTDCPYCDEGRPGHVDSTSKRNHHQTLLAVFFSVYRTR